jgi:UPF0755 protein
MKRSGKRKGLAWALGLMLLSAAVLAGGVAWWLNRPMPLRSATVEVSIEPGTPVREVVRLWTEAGVEVSPEWLYQWFRWSGQSRKIRAGSYELDGSESPRELLARMVRGDETLQTVRLIEGWTFRQVREALARAPHLRATLAGLGDAEVAARLGLGADIRTAAAQAAASSDAPGTLAGVASSTNPAGTADTALRVDGWLFPDTYAYSRGVSDLTVLRRAHAAMRRHLGAVWDERRSDLPLKTPTDLLVLASIVEKETGAAADRGRIAAVFHNRLRLGMPLQSDPTVIFGLGERFDGNLRRSDLTADTPWNTYTRRGLPPTPIAMPGLAALRAVARPDETHALYFVARGDGNSVFSDTLAAHNRAVNQFQRGADR